MESSNVTRRALLAATGASGFGLATMTPAQAADDLKGKELSADEVEAFREQMKESRSCRVLPRTIDGTEASAEVNGGFINNTFFLTVAGKKPFLNMRVVLSPLVYVKQPEYWEIEVLGCTSGIVLPAIGFYNETLSIDSYRGKRGIEVVWADDRYRIEVPPKS
ncbi:hypothetical protein BH23PLA1_BH23PLA1_36100 [soil metagenome]